MFDKILIANRAEIAVRIARTCRDLGVATVAVFSDVDAGALHVELSDEAVALGGVAPGDTYLNRQAVIEAALATGAQAIHPGYGFLAEDAAFAEAIIDAGLAWVGPPPPAMRLMADKVSARRTAESAGVPVVPGALDPLEDPGGVIAFAAEHGYPVAVKAAGGGGGRGLKVAGSPDQVAAGFEAATREAHAYFGSDAVYVERWLEDPKHMEVQVLAPSSGDPMSLGVRDCSLQRRYQKLVEESPPPRFAERAEDMGDAALAMCKACGYTGAGTVEFLVDDGGAFYFLEVNARLQVEHTVTEAVTGLDLVACQLRVAAGDPLGFSQGDIVARGHAIECRINAEDPARGFLPDPGVITRLVVPAGPGIRFDSGYVAGDEVPGAYDSLIAKVITWGSDRDGARAAMVRALGELVVEGVATTAPALQMLLGGTAFRSGAHTTTTVDSTLSDLAVTEPQGGSGGTAGGRPIRLWHPAMAGAAGAAAGAAAEGSMPMEGPGSSQPLAPAGPLVAAAPLQGTVLKVLVAVGEAVEPGQALVVIEAMKMETAVASRSAGVVAAVEVIPGQAVAAGQTLVVLE